MPKIDWGLDSQNEAQTVKLNTIEMNEPHEVEIREITTTNEGLIVATIQSPTLEGTSLWLKGKFGLQNGAFSLINLVDSKNTEDFIGTYSVVKVESETSMSGYRFEWTQ